MSLNTGTILNNRYRVVRLLGQGGFGAVYRAWDISLERPCALKENLAYTEDARRQFGREARILARLSHPSLPHVIDHFVVPERGQYLVMDFVEGENLQTMVERGGPVAPAQALAWIDQVADALAYLHSQEPPVVHRDVKPQNIIIRPDGRAVLVDFGLVKEYDPQMRTTMGARAVTPGYAPPEQYGKGNTDARSDVYALAATLYTLLTGQEPQESVQRIVDDRLRPPHELNPHVSPLLGAAVEHAMSMPPSHRFQTIRNFQAALHGQAPPTSEDATLVVPPPSALQAATARVAPPSTPSYTPVADLGQGYTSRPRSEPRPQAPTTPAPVPGRSRSLPYSYLLGAGLLVALLAAAVYLFFLRNDEPAVVEVTRMQEVVVSRLPSPDPASASAATAASLAVAETSTAAAAATATPNLLATSQAGLRASAEARSRATSTAQAGAVETAVAEARVAGALRHNPDGNIKYVAAGVNLRDFTASVRFYNPYDASVHAWDYGFMFRDRGANDQFRLAVSSDGTWSLSNSTVDDWQELESGFLDGLSIGAGQSNLLRLEVDGDSGLFYLNDRFVAELDLSARANAGDVVVATGFWEGSELPGEVTRYEEFLVEPH